MTLVHWLVNERQQRTRELLETTSLSIERIPGLAGFQTPPCCARTASSVSRSAPGTGEKPLATGLCGQGRRPAIDAS
ncbi:hypothetical protein [Janthinobacterium psychrotolerans]|uniref:hypothetical protein n=1 Tax=Janthinobacterium psychrotolerans TaxID=1747903 RepID=UPI000806770E|nr:hypothetical protein [Janthinobacterium psychrotolerans]